MLLRRSEITLAGAHAVGAVTLACQFFPGSALSPAASVRFHVIIARRVGRRISAIRCMERRSMRTPEGGIRHHGR